jgi:uncharacterized protein YaiE (UPF0345 family)
MTSNAAQFEGVTVVKKANVYGEKCVSLPVHFTEGSRKSVGVIFPSTLTFSTGAAEIMETIAGACRYRLEGQDWLTVTQGQSFNVPANSKFDIEITGEPYHYVCHFE